MSGVSVGDTVKLRVFTGSYLRLKDLTGEVGVVHHDAPFERATVCFDDGSETGLTVRDIPLRYLARAEKEKPKRRGVLNMHAPRDLRTEAQRMDEGVAWLEENGYEVLRVGQSRQAAICHKCTRDAKQFVRIRCETCGSFGYSPSTNSTKGTPDTFVFREGWPVGMMLGMEWKDKPKGRRSEEQTDLERRGRIVVAWDLPSCLMALFRFELSDPRIRPCPDLEIWLAERGLMDKVLED